MPKTKPEMVRPDSPTATSKSSLSISSSGKVSFSTSGFNGGSTCTWHGSRRSLSVTSSAPSSWQPVNSRVWRHNYVITTLDYGVIATSFWRENDVKQQRTLHTTTAATCVIIQIMIDYDMNLISQLNDKMMTTIMMITIVIIITLLLLLLLYFTNTI